MRRLFKIGDIVVYGSQGICKIDCIETKKMGKQSADYYVLKPIFNENTSVFVPIQNKLLIDRMQGVLTKVQVKKLIEEAHKIDVLRCADENQKREQYKEILASGNRERLVSLIKTIREERDTRREVGKKLNLNDEQTLRKAEQLLFNEMAFVLKITSEEAKEMLKF